MEKTTLIQCPKCGNQFNVEDVIAHQLEEKYRDELNQKITSIQADFAAKEKALSEKQLKFDNQVEEKVNVLLKQKQDELKGRIDREYKAKLASLTEESEKDKLRIDELTKVSSENEQLKRRLKTQESEIEFKYERQLTAQLQSEAEAIQKREAEKHELKSREQQKIIDDQKEKLADATRKLEQGSMQLQGEVQELAIEEWLGKQFPLDTITEIKKGANGADCIQIVNTRERQTCGSIYFESKRTQSYQKAWIEKFRNDMREKGANIGVLVTHAMPPDMDRMGLKDGVWICSYEEFKGLCFVLRESVIAISSAITSQENRGDKMSMLYEYLIGNEFRLSVEGILEGFTQMQNDLNSEKRSISAQWKRREKQIEKVLHNTIAMHSSIKGIAGNEIQTIKALELPEALEVIEETDE